MNFILPDLMTLQPGVNLLDHQNRNLLTGRLIEAENAAELLQQAFCLIGLQPSILLYTSKAFCGLSGCGPHQDALPPLSHWLTSLRSADGQPMGAAVEAAISALHETGCLLSSLLIHHFAESHRLETKIWPILAGQALPNRLFMAWNSQRPTPEGCPCGEIWLIKPQQSVRLQRFAPPLYKHPRLTLLNNRELQVLNLLYEGKAALEICHCLHLPAETLKHHRKQILKKTGYPNTDALVAVLRHERE